MILVQSGDMGDTGKWKHREIKDLGWGGRGQGCAGGQAPSRKGPVPFGDPLVKIQPPDPMHLER